MISPTPFAIEVKGIVKNYGDVRALEGIEFSVMQGELFGFLGPNGAGKTTTINILTGLAKPDIGAVRILGVDCSHTPKAAQHLIGVIPDESNLYPELSGFDNLSFCGSLYGMDRKQRESRASELLELLDLAKASKRKFSTYSKGMKRKLTIAAGIMHSPRVLFMDEPTTGIDVMSARQIRRLVTQMHQQGTTIFLTTHYIEEAERLCQRVAFIVEGRIVHIDSIDALLGRVSGKSTVAFSCSEPCSSLVEAMSRDFPNYRIETAMKTSITVTSDAPVGIGTFIRYFEERNFEVVEARKITPSLEDVFVSITGVEAGVMKSEREKAR